MNKQIAALLEQARTKDYWSEGRYLVDFINQEKFAKLIIRECVTMLDNNGNYLIDDVATKQIEKYFGIEE